MVSSKATTVGEYLQSLSPERREHIDRVRRLVRKNLPRGFEEGMQYGMIGWYVPLSRYPDTYNGQALGVAALSSQKQYMSLYLMAVYGEERNREFRKRWKESGKKVDMGKACVRFRSSDDLPLDVIGELLASTTVDGFIASYERVRANTKTGLRKRKRPSKAGAPTKTAGKSAPAKKASKKRTVTKKRTAKKSVTKKSAAKKKASVTRSPRRKK